MKLYTAKVRLAGDRDHEVIKNNLTAAEMKLLEHIHVSPKGHPTLVEIVHTGMVEEYDPSDEEEEVITQVEQPVRTRLGRPRKAEAE